MSAIDFLQAQKGQLKGQPCWVFLLPEALPEEVFVAVSPEDMDRLTTMLSSEDGIKRQDKYIRWVHTSQSLREVQAMPLNENVTVLLVLDGQQRIRSDE